MSHLVIHPHNALNSQVWAGLKLGVRTQSTLKYLSHHLLIAGAKMGAELRLESHCQEAGVASRTRT